MHSLSLQCVQHGSRFINLLGLSGRTEEYFTFTTAANFMTGGNRAERGGNPRPSAVRPSLVGPQRKRA